MTLSLSAEDKMQLTEVAQKCGYSNVTAFIRAIAKRQIEIAVATENNLSSKIDQCFSSIDALNALSEERLEAWKAIAKLQEKAIAELQEAVYKK